MSQNSNDIAFLPELTDSDIYTTYEASGGGNFYEPVLHKEHVHYAGWLWKVYGTGPQQTWKRQWFYLLDDRLCYTLIPSPGQVVRYLPLDRIPIRPLPRHYGPQIGVSKVSSWQVLRRPQGCVFAVHCGRRTHFMAAESAALATAWVRKITEVWIHAVQHADREMVGSTAAGTTAWSMANIRDLLCEASGLRESVDRLLWIADKKRATVTRGPASFSNEVAYEVQVVTGNVQDAGSDLSVYLELCDNLGSSSGTFRLDAMESHLKPFQQATISYCQVICRRLAQVQKLTVQCDASSPGWFIEEVWVRSVKDCTWTYFLCNKWLTEADGPLELEREGECATACKL